MGVAGGLIAGRALRCSCRTPLGRGGALRHGRRRVGPDSLACLLAFWPCFIRRCWLSGGCFAGPVLMGLRGICARYVCQCLDLRVFWRSSCGGCALRDGRRKGPDCLAGFQVLWPPPWACCLHCGKGAAVGLMALHACWSSDPSSCRGVGFLAVASLARFSWAFVAWVPDSVRQGLGMDSLLVDLGRHVDW